MKLGRTTLLAVATVLSLLVFTLVAWGQEGGSGAGGGSAVADTAQEPSGEGSAPADQAHAASPHTGGLAAQFAKLRDSIRPSKELPAGSVRVRLSDGDGQPIAGRAVTLEALKTSIAAGNSTKESYGTTDASGYFTFANQETTSDFGYRVIIKDAPAEYSTPSFNLQRTMGEDVEVHLYPIARTIEQAFLVMVERMSVQPRDDVFRFEVSIEVQNFGRTTLVPENMKFRLPAGAKAFQASTDESDRKFVEVDNAAELRGTYAPGTQKLSYGFDVPNDHEHTASFEVGLAPRLRSALLIVEASPEMSLVVPQLGEAVERQHNTGQRLLVASRNFLERMETSPSSLRLTLKGLPTPSRARYLAVLIAVLIVGGGFWHFASQKGKGATWGNVAPSDLERAKDILLAELVAVEDAYAEERIGPKTHDRAKQALLDALGRLLARPSSESR